MYPAVQTPSSNFEIVIGERSVASELEAVGCNNGNENGTTRNSPATHTAVSPLPCCTFRNTRPGKVYRIAAGFLLPLYFTRPDAIAETIMYAPVGITVRLPYLLPMVAARLPLADSPGRYPRL